MPDEELADLLKALARDLERDTLPSLLAGRKDDEDADAEGWLVTGAEITGVACPCNLG